MVVKFITEIISVHKVFRYGRNMFYHDDACHGCKLVGEHLNTQILMNPLDSNIFMSITHTLMI